MTNPIAPRVLSCQRTGAECGFFEVFSRVKIELAEIATLRSRMGDGVFRMGRQCCGGVRQYCGWVMAVLRMAETVLGIGDEFLQLEIN